MAGRGRPRGSGYDDTGNIRAVRRLMALGMSRRSAIIQACGVDQLRRIEIKMRFQDMADEVEDSVDRIVRATLKGMLPDGVALEDVTVTKVAYYTVEGLAGMASKARDLGFAIVYASDGEPGPAKA